MVQFRKETSLWRQVTGARGRGWIMVLILEKRHSKGRPGFWREALLQREPWILEAPMQRYSEIISASKISTIRVIREAQTLFFQPGFVQQARKLGSLAGCQAQSSSGSKTMALWVCQTQGGSTFTFWNVTWPFVRVEQAIISPHLKEGSPGLHPIQVIWSSNYPIWSKKNCQRI